MKVAPYVGAWIETYYLRHENIFICVAPHVGAWIETFMSYPNYFAGLSRPTWARGLKPVDGPSRIHAHSVAPHAGAWIETIRTTRAGTGV